MSKLKKTEAQNVPFQADNEKLKNEIDLLKVKKQSALNEGIKVFIRLHWKSEAHYPEKLRRMFVINIRQKIY